MKTVIVFSSKYGATEKCVGILKAQLGDVCDVVNLSVDVRPDLAGYDTVLLGSSIYAGKMRPEVINYVTDNELLLRNKNLGVLICCKDAHSEALHYIEENLPEWLNNNAFIRMAVGHEINLEKMNFLERNILKYVFKVKNSYSKLDEAALADIVAAVNALK